MGGSQNHSRKSGSGRRSIREEIAGKKTDAVKLRLQEYSNGKLVRDEPVANVEFSIDEAKAFFTPARLP